MANFTSGEIGNMANKIVDEMNSEDCNFNDYVSRTDPEVMARARVRLADELLRQLEETQ